MGEVNNCFQSCISEYVLMKCLLISVSISYTCVKVLSPPFTGIHFHNLPATNVTGQQLSSPLCGSTDKSPPLFQCGKKCVKPASSGL